MPDRVIILMILINVCALNSTKLLEQLKETKSNIFKTSAFVIMFFSVHIVAVLAFVDLMSLVF